MEKRYRTVSNRFFSRSLSLSLFFSLTVNSEREGEKERESENEKRKKNLHQIAIRRVLRRVTFRNRHIYIYIPTRVVDSCQTLSHSFELRYDAYV